MVVVVVVTLIRVLPGRGKVQVTVVRVVVLVHMVVVPTRLVPPVVVQWDLHAKGMTVVRQTVVLQERPVVVVPVALVGIVRVVALLRVQVV